MPRKLTTFKIANYQNLFRLSFSKNDLLLFGVQMFSLKGCILHKIVITSFS